MRFDLIFLYDISYSYIILIPVDVDGIIRKTKIVIDGKIPGVVPVDVVVGVIHDFAYLAF